MREECTFDFPIETGLPALPDGWSYLRGEIKGDDACKVEGCVCGMDSGDALMMFAEPPGVDRADMTPAQAIDNIINRCRDKGITVEPGEVIVDAHGQWTFRGWRLSRG